MSAGFLASPRQAGNRSGVAAGYRACDSHLKPMVEHLPEKRYG